RYQLEARDVLLRQLRERRVPRRTVVTGRQSPFAVRDVGDEVELRPTGSHWWCGWRLTTRWLAARVTAGGARDQYCTSPACTDRPRHRAPPCLSIRGLAWPCVSRSSADLE